VEEEIFWVCMGSEHTPSLVGIFQTFTLQKKKEKEKPYQMSQKYNVKTKNVSWILPHTRDHRKKSISRENQNRFSTINVSSRSGTPVASMASIDKKKALSCRVGVTRKLYNQ
jgi:hypothetical protein